MAASQSLKMSADALSTKETARPDLDAAVGALGDRAREFARLAPAQKAALLRECIPTLLAVAGRWVAGGCAAKGIDPASTTVGEEWIAGPNPTMRNLRLLVDSLGQIAREGRPAFGRSARTRSGAEGAGRVEVDLFPASAQDKALYAGFTAKALMEPGLDEKSARERQAAFYQKQDPEGGVALILGAGNVSSIPPMDAFYKMFVEGYVCLLKMNPVNEYIGPFLEEGLAPLIRRGYLKISYGGGDVGKYLVEHPAVADVHITGSDRTHDLIVWGPPGPERERRKRDNDPLLKKRITSELGNVSPVAIVPAEYSDEELWFQARNVATMVGNNGSFNCNAAKVLLVAEKWPQRARFHELYVKALGAVPPRQAYYPGAQDRYDTLTAGRTVEKLGHAGEGALPWTVISGVRTEDADQRLFTVEPFCGILTEATLAESDPVAFLDAATKFMNDRMWGTLNATIVIHPRHEKDPVVGGALDRAILALRYGTVAINHWPALGYAFATPPWGGHPSATLADIQSGLGWVHNTFMLEGIEKSVVRGPLRVSPKPAWFADHKKIHLLGPKAFAFEADPSWLRVPGLALLALGG